MVLCPNHRGFTVVLVLYLKYVFGFQKSKVLAEDKYLTSLPTCSASVEVITTNNVTKPVNCYNIVLSGCYFSSYLLSHDED